MLNDFLLGFMTFFEDVGSLPSSKKVILILILIPSIFINPTKIDGILVFIYQKQKYRFTLHILCFKIVEIIKTLKRGRVDEY